MAMALNKTAYRIRKVAPEHHVSRVMRWVLAFCLGYACCHVLHDMAPPSEIEICE